MTPIPTVNGWSSPGPALLPPGEQILLYSRQSLVACTAKRGQGCERGSRALDT